MSDLQVIYDPTLQLGAIVDLDTNLGFGPICAGPEGGNLLQAFVDGMPFDISILTPEQARDIFMSVFRDDAQASIQAAGQTPASNVDTTAGATADEQALAQATAVASNGAPPEPAPADADMEANQGETPTVTDPPTQEPTGSATPTDGAPAGQATTGTTNCLVCNAQGTGSNNPACPVCGGTGTVAIQ